MVVILDYKSGHKGSNPSVLFIFIVISYFFFQEVNIKEKYVKKENVFLSIMEQIKNS